MSSSPTAISDGAVLQMRGLTLGHRRETKDDLDPPNPPSARVRRKKTSKRPKPTASALKVSSLLAEQLAEISEETRARLNQIRHSFVHRQAATSQQAASPTFNSAPSPKPEKSPIKPPKLVTPNNTPMFASVTPSRMPNELFPIPSKTTTTISPSKVRKPPTPSNTPIIMPVPPEMAVWSTPSITLSSPVKSTNAFASSIANISPSKVIPEELSISTPNNTPMLIPSVFVVPPTNTTLTSHVQSQSGTTTDAFTSTQPHFKVRRPITPNNTPMINSSMEAKATGIASPSPLVLPQHSFRSPPALPLNSPKNEFGSPPSMRGLVERGSLINTPIPIAFADPETPARVVVFDRTGASPVTPAPNLAAPAGRTPPAKSPMFAPPITVSKRRALRNSRASGRLSSEGPESAEGDNGSAGTASVATTTAAATEAGGAVEEGGISSSHNNSSNSQQPPSTAQRCNASVERIAWLETTVARLRTEKEVETSLLRHQQTIAEEKSTAQIEKLKQENALLLRRLHDMEYKDVEIRKLNLQLKAVRRQFAAMQEMEARRVERRRARLERAAFS